VTVTVTVIVMSNATSVADGVTVITTAIGTIDGTAATGAIGITVSAIATAMIGATTATAGTETTATAMATATETETDTSSSVRELDGQARAQGGWLGQPLSLSVKTQGSIALLQLAKPAQLGMLGAGVKAFTMFDDHDPPSWQHLRMSQDPQGPRVFGFQAVRWIEKDIVGCRPSCFQLPQPFSHLASYDLKLIVDPQRSQVFLDERHSLGC
jgi:hypothetical protein